LWLRGVSSTDQTRSVPAVGDAGAQHSNEVDAIVNTPYKRFIPRLKFSTLDVPATGVHSSNDYRFFPVTRRQGMAAGYEWDVQKP
jgi:hypothetical protein